MTIIITQERLDNVVAVVRANQGNMTRNRLKDVLQLNESSVYILVRHCLNAKLLVESVHSAHRKTGVSSMLSIPPPEKEAGFFSGWGKADRLGLPGDENWMTGWAQS